MTSFDYNPRGSWVETFDARAQIVFYLCFTTSVLIVRDWRALLGLCVVAAIIALSARLPWRETRRAWLYLFVFIVIFTIPNMLFGKGIGFAARNALMLLAVFLATIVIGRTIDPRSCGVVLRGLGVSDKLAFSMNLTMRYVPTLVQDFGETIDAQKARGLELDKPKGGFVGRVRRRASLLIPVFARSLAEATDVENAMDLRAFGATKHRTWLHELHWRARDNAAIAAGVCLLVAIILFALLTRA
jgi:energy-coupling factor transport system permease protein